MPEASLRIALIDDDPLRAAVVEEGLREAGHRLVVRLEPGAELLRRLSEADPDVVIIDLGDPSRDTLEQMFAVSRHTPRPIAMFVDQSDSGAIAAAVEAGVSAYVVDGLKKERIRPVIETSIARFRAVARLKEELARAKTELEERKILDRAKGILMERRGVSEPEAHAMLRRAAMNEGRRMADVAQSIITAAELLK